MSAWRAILLAGSCLILSADDASAQIVSLGPGGGVQVRAPFVRVDVAPDGSTSVRAPFTSVDAPGRFGVAPRPTYPAGRFGVFRPILEPEATPGTIEPADPAAMNWRQLRREARDRAARFELALEGLGGYSHWLSTLRPGTIRDLLAGESDQPPDRSTVERLAEILDRFDAVTGAADLAPIVSLEDFEPLRAALRELTMPPTDRHRRELVNAWMLLRDDLGRFSTGAAWREYLAMPPELLAEGLGDSERLGASSGQFPDPSRLVDLLGRFHQVDGDGRYGAIARLPNFQATRELLSGYVELQGRLDSDPALPPVPPEPIPLPEPLP